LAPLRIRNGDKLKAAVIGAGAFGRHHASKYRGIEGVELISNDFGIEVELSAVFARPKRWRIYECAINYYGRTYDEGKKIGWRDGVLALWYVVKFRFLRRAR